MTHTKDEALKLALEALDNLLYWDNGKPEYDEAREAITAIKQALAAPTVQDQSCSDVQLAEQIMSDCGISTTYRQALVDRIANRITSHRPTQPAVQEPEPNGWAISYDGKTPYAIWPEGDGPLLDLEVKRQGGTCCKLPIYTTPPAAQPAPVQPVAAPKEYTMGNWFNDLENPHGNR